MFCGYCRVTTAGTHEADCPMSSFKIETHRLDPWPSFAPGFQVASCDHCWCRVAPPDAGYAEGPHRQCCKCLTRMAERFIPAFAEP